MVSSCALANLVNASSTSAIRNILADRIYLYDRGYSSFALLRAHYTPSARTPSEEEVLEVKSHFVVRTKKEGGNSPSLSDAIDRPLTDEDRAAGVTSDRVGYFTSDTARREGISKIPLREVIIPYEDGCSSAPVPVASELIFPLVQIDWPLRAPDQSFQ
jgi:hypothetical protein